MTNLGDLKSVKITVKACGYTETIELESSDQSEIDYVITATGNVIATIPSIPEEEVQLQLSKIFSQFQTVIQQTGGTDYANSVSALQIALFAIPKSIS